MPIMELVLEQSYYNQQCVNRWNYLASGTPSAVSFSFALISAIGAIPELTVYPVTGMIQLIADTQHEDVDFTQVGAKDVYDPVDFYQTPFVPPLTGALDTGDASSPVLASGYRTTRTRTDIRRATKRFVGLDENNVGPGGVLTTNYQTIRMEPLRAKMSQVLTYDDEGNTLSFSPIVVSKEKYVPNAENPDKFAYRYYDTEAEQLDHIMTSISWEIYTTARTQGSRQYGKGA